MSYLLIGGDFVPTESNESLMIDLDFQSLFGSQLTDILKKAEKVILNLETPLCDSTTPIDKHGPNLKSNPQTMRLLREMNNCILSLANNHIMDQGIEGYRSTKQVLQENNIPFWGVGDQIDSVSSTYIINTKSNLKIGIYSCVEHEFSVASDHTPGANPFDPFLSYIETAKLSKKCDYTIVLYHGGIEHYRYPSPQLQKRCRRFVDSGANLVVTQHSHCIGAQEDYKESRIIYGQGNFLFDHSESIYWKTGLLISLDLSTFELQYYPIVKTNNTTRCATQSESKDILDAFLDRSKKILMDVFIEEEFEKFSSQRLENYLLYFSGVKRLLLFRLLNFISFHSFQRIFLIFLHNKKNRLAIYNYISCESHLEALQTGLFLQNNTTKNKNK